jgi:hypothetical protein
LEEHVTSIFRVEARNQHEAGSKQRPCLLHVPLKCQLTFNRLHDVISQKYNSGKTYVDMEVKPGQIGKHMKEIAGLRKEIYENCRYRYIMNKTKAKSFTYELVPPYFQ